MQIATSRSSPRDKAMRRLECNNDDLAGTTRAWRRGTTRTGSAHAF
jgi:hypothetical protein